MNIEIEFMASMEIIVSTLKELREQGVPFIKMNKRARRFYMSSHAIIEREEQFFTKTKFSGFDFVSIIIRKRDFLLATMICPPLKVL